MRPPLHKHINLICCGFHCESKSLIKPSGRVVVFDMYGNWQFQLSGFVKQLIEEKCSEPRVTIFLSNCDVDDPYFVVPIIDKKSSNRLVGEFYDVKCVRAVMLSVVRILGAELLIDKCCFFLFSKIRHRKFIGSRRRVKHLHKINILSVMSAERNHGFVLHG